MPPVAGEPKPCAYNVSYHTSTIAVLIITLSARQNNNMGTRVTYVEGSALTVQGPNDVRSAHGLALAHLHDGADVSEDVGEECLQVESDLLVGRGRDALDAATARKAADGWLW